MSSILPLKITFHLDGSGVYLDPSEPIMLDGLLAWALAPFHCKGDPPARDEPPDDIPLPLGRWEIGGVWGWHASTLFPDGENYETLQYWRKRFRQSRAELVSKIERSAAAHQKVARAIAEDEGDETNVTVNIASGSYRDYNMPMPLVLTSKMTAWALGDRKRVEQILRKHIRNLGKKRAYGKGRISSVVVEHCEQDFSLTDDGLAMRWLPQEGGLRIVRPRPPYWNIVGAVACCEIGDVIR
jgi:CRISPR type IV-associated protein Csf3